MKETRIARRAEVELVPAMRLAMAELSQETPDLADLPHLYQQLDRLLFVMRVWRSVMDNQTRFQTPDLPWCLRYAMMESAEIMDAWAKGTLQDPRNRPADSPISHEYTDTLAMMITALHRPEATLPGHPIWSFATWEETAPQIEIARHNLKQIQGAGGSVYDLICIEAANALRFYFTHEAFWQNHAISVIYLCVEQLNRETFTEFARVLAKWEQRWHPDQRIS